MTKSFSHGNIKGMATGYNFIKFERDFTTGEDKISISYDSAIRFSAKFCKITDINNYNYALLYFDPVKHSIGIYPSNEREKGSFKITKEKFAASISATSFLKANKIDPKIYHGSYSWTKENIPSVGQLYIINLPNKNETDS